MNEVNRLQAEHDRDLVATRRDLRECQEANAELRADLDAARQRIAELSSPETMRMVASAEALCGCSSELYADAAAEVVL